MINNFAFTGRLCYSLESWLTRQIMVPTIVIALINCWEHLYNWFENWVYAFCIFIGHDFCDQLWVADCPSWIYGPSTELPSLRYRRQLPWLGWDWRRALTQRALCPLMPWSRLTKIVYLEDGSFLLRVFLTPPTKDIVQSNNFTYWRGLTHVGFKFTIGLESTQ